MLMKKHRKMKKTSKSLLKSFAFVNFPRVQKNFRRFCEHTSFHGFESLVNAKSVFWKLFWFIITTFSLIITAYQIGNSIQDFVATPTNTLILPATEEEVLYPELGLCYWHWIYWVDAEKVKSLKYSKEMIIYGLTFFNTMFSMESFDVDRSRDDFDEMLKKNNLSKVFEFFNSISRLPPPIEEKDETTKFKTYFDKTSILFKDPNVFFCYRVSSENMFKYFQRYKLTHRLERKVISFSTLDETFTDLEKHLHEYLDFVEFDHYMRRWIIQKTNYNITANASSEKLRTFIVPIVLFLNGYTEPGIQILAENDAYFIDMTASAAEWLNKPTAPCVENSKTFVNNDTCEMQCVAQESYDSNCTCQYLENALLVDDDVPKNVCRKEIRIISPSGDESSSKTTDRNMWKDRKCTINASAAYDQCLDNCAVSCRVWKYDVVVSVTTMSSNVRSIGTKGKTDITIVYPDAKDVVILIETSAQSWESFIGGVGGLLGIWTGASILSFIELIYFCCLADCDNTDMFQRHSIRSQIFTTNVDPVPRGSNGSDQSTQCTVVT